MPVPTALLRRLPANVTRLPRAHVWKTVRDPYNQRLQAWTGRGMRAMPARHQRRREKILSTARELIAKHGYDGVKMRDLAAASKVAPKTLYHQFESKEKLLRTAVEERFRHLYPVIDDAEIDHGIDRLFYIVDSVASTTRKNLAYARALAPLLRDQAATTFSSIRTATYRKAIVQIAQEKEFVNWDNIDLIVELIRRNVNPLYLDWFYGRSTYTKYASMAKLEICLVMRSVTKGYTHRRATAVLQEILETFERS